MREVQIGEVLVEQGDSDTPIFIVISGEIEIVRLSGTIETIITVVVMGSSLGDRHALSTPFSICARVTKPGKVTALDRQYMMALL